jgi:thiol-disulfide isomerase/thioredoxin
MKYIIGLLGMLLPILSGAQSPPIKPLNIGDTVPDITITNVYNYPASTIHLSDLNGKLVILDFWSTWCGACIKAFPKMHQLQKEFGDQLQIVLVNTYAGDSIQRVRPFFEKRKARTGQEVTLPYSLLQPSLAAYFPFRIVPHYVWIRNGKLIATTSQFEITKESIQNALDGKTTVLHIKNDIIDFDKNKPLFFEGNGGTNQFLFRSIITGYKEGVGGASGIQTDSSGKFTRLYVINNSINSLLRIAYPNIFRDCAANQIIVGKNVSVRIQQEVTTPVQFRYTDSYCYDIFMPPVSRNEMLQFFREDLYRSFHIKVKSESRLLPCLILLNSSKLKHKESTGGVKSNHLHTISTFTKVLNEHPAFRNLHVINDISSGNMISVQIPDTINTLNEMKHFLKKQGFDFREEKRLINVAVIEGN